MDVDRGDEKLMSALEESEIGMERKKGPVVCVEVKDCKQGTTSVWSLSKFKWVVCSAWCEGVCGVRRCAV